MVGVGVVRVMALEVVVVALNTARLLVILIII